MPELPEVETVVRGLSKLITNRTITKVTTRAPRTSWVIDPALKAKTLNAGLAGQTVTEITRRGKNILIGLTSDRTLWVHLKMTGKFVNCPAESPRDKHDLFLFDFDGAPPLHVRFNDYRRFGRLRLFLNENLWQQPGLADLGPEPLEITAEEFVALCKRRPRQIKAALLDQSFLAGIGNIYADESLFASRLHPRRLTTSISPKKLHELHAHLQRLLNFSISKMGTTVDTYSGVNGRPGSFQNYLLVYNREDGPCENCGHTIKREKIGSRSAHFCPHCQRPPRLR